VGPRMTGAFTKSRRICSCALSHCQVEFLPLQTCMTYRRFRMRSLVLALALTTFFPLFAGAKSSSDGWKIVKQKSGIVVSEKSVEGRSLPIFRGVTVINESIFDILAVLQDTPRNVEWMHNCSEARRIEQLNEWDVVLYNRTASPWPVNDRDAVIMSHFKIIPAEKKVHIHLKSTTHKAQPAVEGVVRMPHLDGHYEFTILGDKVTKVDFKINADPGGWIPKWVAKLVSRDIPYKTLSNLRKQVKKTRGAPEYKAFIVKAKATIQRTGSVGNKVQVAAGH